MTQKKFKKIKKIKMLTKKDKMRTNNNKDVGKAH